MAKCTAPNLHLGWIWRITRLADWFQTGITMTTSMLSIAQFEQRFFGESRSWGGPLRGLERWIKKLVIRVNGRDRAKETKRRTVMERNTPGLPISRFTDFFRLSTNWRTGVSEPLK